MPMHSVRKPWKICVSSDLRWVLSAYEVDNSLEGWRELALQFVLEWCEALSPIYRQESQTGGRPRDTDTYFARQALADFANSMKAQAAKEGKSRRLGSKAATSFHAQLKRKAVRGVSERYRVPTIGTIRNWLGEPVVTPEFMKQYHVSRLMLVARTKGASHRVYDYQYAWIAQSFFQPFDACGECPCVDKAVSQTAWVRSAVFCRIGDFSVEKTTHRFLGWPLHPRKSRKRFLPNCPVPILGRL